MLHVKKLDVSMLTPTKLPGPSCHLLLMINKVDSFTAHKDRNNERARSETSHSYSLMSNHFVDVKQRQ